MLFEREGGYQPEGVAISYKGQDIRSVPMEEVKVVPPVVKKRKAATREEVSAAASDFLKSEVEKRKKVREPLPPAPSGEYLLAEITAAKEAREKRSLKRTPPPLPKQRRTEPPTHQSAA